MQKVKPIKSKKVRDSARGEDCTLNISNACNYDVRTTVLCHLPDDSGTGKTSGKSDDVYGVYGCSTCHAIIDGRMPWPSAYDAGQVDFYQLRALKRTIRRMIDNGTIKIA